MFLFVPHRMTRLTPTPMTSLVTQLMTRLMTILMTPLSAITVLSLLMSFSSHVSVEAAVTGSLFTGEKFRTFDISDLHDTEQISSLYSKQEQSIFECESWFTVTSISHQLSESLKIAAGIPGWCVFIAGDVKGPTNWKSGNWNIFYLSIADQMEFTSPSQESFSLVEKLPFNSIGRKNVAYLLAISQNAKNILDLDDDNIITNVQEFLRITSSISKQKTKSPNVRQQGSLTSSNPQTIKNCQVFNPYGNDHGNLKLWPRGFPLTSIGSPADEAPTFQAAESTTDQSELLFPGIAQFVSYGDPDVDAIHRLTRPTDASMVLESLAERTDQKRASTTNFFTPFNSQATLFHPSVFWCLYLPVSVNGRVSDIWRSYICQRLIGLMEIPVGVKYVFEEVIVRRRNERDLLRDFQGESDLYLKTEALIKILCDWQADVIDLPDAMIRLYIYLYERGFIGVEDVSLVQLWMADLTRIGYKFPAISRPLEVI